MTWLMQYETRKPVETFQDIPGILGLINFFD